MTCRISKGPAGISARGCWLEASITNVVCGTARGPGLAGELGALGGRLCPWPQANPLHPARLGYFQVRSKVSL